MLWYSIEDGGCCGWTTRPPPRTLPPEFLPFIFFTSVSAMVNDCARCLLGVLRCIIEREKIEALRCRLRRWISGFVLFGDR